MSFWPFSPSSGSGDAQNSPRVLRGLDEMRRLREELDGNQSIGFVPTMGALHEGHLNLMKKAKEENDIVVISIFVNPTQFGPNEDLNKYPRKLEADIDLAKGVGVDYVFAPVVEDMYSASHRCYVVPDGFDQLSEGRARPGHFRGVATIVTKLFGLVRPSKAYFGQKDAMQCVLMKRLVEDLNLSPKIVICPTVREPDGLALSSRNVYLNTEERKAAPTIYAALKAVEKAYQDSEAPQRKVQDLRLLATSILAKEPLIHSIEYVSIARPDTMEDIDDEIDTDLGAIVSVALRLGSTRLIDNIVL